MILLKASEVLALKKAKEMPVGTVSKGRKKVAKGKWVPVPTNRERREKAKVKGEIYHNGDGSYEVSHASLGGDAERYETLTAARRRLRELRKEPVKDGERKQLANKGGVSLYHNYDNTYSVYHGSLKYGSESFKTEAEARKRLVEVAKDVKSGKLKPPSSESLLDMY